MTVHFLEPSPYLRRYLDFIRQNSSHFPPSEHRFVIYVPQGANTSYVPLAANDLKVIGAKRECLVEVLSVGRGDNVLIHGLFNPYLTLALLLRPGLIARSAWSIWGGDLYFFKHLNSFSDHGFELLRRLLLPRIPNLVTFVAGDVEVARTVYGCRGRHLVAFYPNPLEYGRLPTWRAKSPGDPLVFLVGNSGASTNNHIDSLQRLARFAGENVEIICPLSYGGSEEYVSGVLQCGTELFGTKFSPLTDYMQPEDYMDVLERVDIAVMNHDRQQGLGNLLALLAMGKTLYLRESSTAYGYLKENGVDVRNVEDLSIISFESVPVPSEATSTNGRSFVTSNFSHGRALRQWRDVFTAVKASH